MNRYWIIEHPTRGSFDRWDNDPTSGNWRPFFHWSGLRTDENVKRFYDLAQAQRELAKITKEVPRCYIHEMTGHRRPAGRAEGEDMRTWFTEGNTPLSPEDRAILDRTTRNLCPPGTFPTRELLTKIRMAYKPGMSTKDMLALLAEDDT